jgi:hypothetical protein
MKNNIVRLFVVTLALAGFGATAVSARTAANHKLGSSAQKMSEPMCVPSDPSHCGLK